MSQRLSLYGLVVEPDFALHQNRPAPPDAPVDVTISRGSVVSRADHAPPGHILLSLTGDRPLYTATRLTSGEHLLRFHGTCDFRISSDLRHVSVHPMEGADPAMSTVLTVGGMLAFQLYLRGHAVLHASAVDVGGEALCFVGAPGMGKSTLATLMCADGAQLITDDVLRVEFDEDGVRTCLGATELRLRKGADALRTRFGGDDLPELRRSADDRQVLALADAAGDRLPLRAVVIPVPSRDIERQEITRLRQQDAVFALINFPRLLGWRDRTVVSRHFAHVSRLVERVPVYVARIPWGPPFRPELAEELRSAVVA